MKSGKVSQDMPGNDAKDIKKKSGLRKVSGVGTRPLRWRIFADGPSTQGVLQNKTGQGDR